MQKNSKSCVWLLWPEGGGAKLPLLAVGCVTSFQRIQYGKGEEKRDTLQWEP